jgi:Ssp1 endopeptidase immunity protein Rap1a
VVKELLKIILLGVFVLMVLPYPCRAEKSKLDVQELLEKCDSPGGSETAWYCVGYIGGVSDMMGLNGGARSAFDKEASATLSRMAMCWEGGFPSFGARMQAFTNWAKKHPEEWGDPQLQGVVKAMRETWPCPPSIVPKNSN